MAKILKGIDVVNTMKEKMISDINDMKSKGIEPCLAIVRIGKRADDLSYERSAIKRCQNYGVSSKVYEFEDNVGENEFLSKIKDINLDNKIHGILLLRPFPAYIDDNKVIDIMDPMKDIDCMTPVNIAKVFAGDKTGFAPCTAEAVIRILEHYNINLTGENAVVIGRSLVVGKPLAMMLLKMNATVTICHTKTKNIEKLCSQAKILIAAAGKANMVTSDYIKNDAIVIDVGINVDDSGNLCGDVDTEEVSKVCSAITPVPGGVGTVTNSVLIEHLIRAAKNINNIH